MWKASAAVLVGVGLCAAVAWGQRQALPPGPMQEKARVACLPCHDARIIVQQKMDRKQWAKNMDKMIRWGAPVEPADREALIDYFAGHFGPEEPPASAALAKAPGVERARAACLGCHDAGVIVAQRLDRRGWDAVLARQIRWGARVQAAERQALLDYLVANYGPPARPPAKKQ
jgi:hypothetical protein